VSLYPEARVNLSDDQQQMLDQWENSATALPPEGPNVVTNIQNESHLVGDPPQAGSSAFQAFLREIVNGIRMGGARRAFEEAAGLHLLQGESLRSTPPALHRFRPLDRFAETVAGANGEISEARRNPDEYVTNLLENWDTIGREKVSRTMLAVRPPVFVTFPKPDGSVVSDVSRSGPQIMDALGVRMQAAQDVVGLRYLPPDERLKYPTVADGGWNQDFAVSDPTDDYGWTRQISTAGRGWPEAVHKNRRADLVTEKPLRYLR
jgi:hypothetical protein